LISSTAIRTASLRDVSEIAIVPVRECRIPIFTGSASFVQLAAAKASRANVARDSATRQLLKCFNMGIVLSFEVVFSIL
jgi:hypothetical protein